MRFERGIRQFFAYLGKSHCVETILNIIASISMMGNSPSKDEKNPAEGTEMKQCSICHADFTLLKLLACSHPHKRHYTCHPCFDVLSVGNENQASSKILCPVGKCVGEVTVVPCSQCHATFAPSAVAPCTNPDEPHFFCRPCYETSTGGANQDIMLCPIWTPAGECCRGSMIRSTVTWLPEGKRKTQAWLDKTQRRIEGLRFDDDPRSVERNGFPADVVHADRESTQGEDAPLIEQSQESSLVRDTKPSTQGPVPNQDDSAEYVNEEAIVDAKQPGREVTLHDNATLTEPAEEVSSRVLVSPDIRPPVVVGRHLSRCTNDRGMRRGGRRLNVPLGALATLTEAPSNSNGAAVCTEETPLNDLDRLVRLVEEALTLGQQGKCPGCRIETVKTGGCSTVNCKICKCKWCFCCGNALKGSISCSTCWNPSSWHKTDSLLVLDQMPSDMTVPQRRKTLYFLKKVKDSVQPLLWSLLRSQYPHLLDGCSFLRWEDIDMATLPEFGTTRPDGIAW